MTRGEPVEERTLWELIDGPQVGEIAGIRFDLRHPALDPAVWKLQGLPLPFLWFPWRLKGEWCCWERERDDIEVTEGDTVTISRVANVALRTDVDDRVEPEYRFAYFQINNRSGAVSSVNWFESYCPLDAIGPYSPYLDYGDDGYDDYVRPFMIDFSKIAARIERLEQQGEREQWPSFAREAAELASDELAELKSHVKGEPWLGYAVVDLAAAAGYALAQAELGGRLRPLAERGLRALRAQAIGARSASARADPVRAAALADIKEHPKTSQTACARRVAIKLGRDQGAVTKIISGMFETRLLSGGVREKRPRPDMLQESSTLSNRRMEIPSDDRRGLPSVRRYRAPP